MDILNVQSLVAQGFITDIASIDPNNAYITIGVYQPGNRPAGSGNNTYPSYAIPVSEFLNGSSAITGAQNGLNLVGTIAELGGTLIHNTDIDIAGFSMLFKNGSYPILFLDPSKQQVAIGSNNPNAMLDITAVGSSTVGLNLNTSSTQDAKLHFRTNNSLTPRTQVYLENSTQTFNVYTVNNDTIFWNGNGLAQSKTLTLFTDTTAKFESSLNIGAGNINLRTLSGSPSYAAMYMNVTPSSSNYILASNGATLIVNGPSEINFAVNNSSKAIMDVNKFNVLQPMSVGSILPSGSQQFAVSGLTYMKGIDSTSSNYALKVDNSASSPLLYVRNDGRIEFGSITNPAEFFYFDPTTIEFYVSVGNQSLNLSTDLFGLYDLYNFIQSGDSGGGSSLTMAVTNNFFIREYVSNSLLFNVTSAGKINAPLLPTSNAGLSTGDLYIDTAANILANGDKVVGWKV